MANAKSAIVWSAVERFSVQGSQFILSLIIARLVTPADFGLIAMLSIFLTIAQCFTDSGFGSALVQKGNRTEVDFSTVFYFNIIIAITLYILLFFSAPAIARFYDQPPLVNVTRFMGLNLILQSLSLVQRTKLIINLNFKLISKISLAAMLLSGGAGIYMAYIGYGVWALVSQTLGNSLLLAVLYWSCTKWRPLLNFSVNSFKCLFYFGSKLLFSSLLHNIYLNLYSLVIGKFYNATNVGYYNRACIIAQYPPINLVTIITNVIYPLQCEHQHDREWIIQQFPRFLRMACFIVFPVMVYLAIIAKPMVLIILSEKWIDSAPLISILCVAYMWIAVGLLNNSLINSSGRSDLYMKAEIIKKIVAVVILILTIHRGLTCLCFGLLIYNIIDICIIIYFTREVYPIGFRRQFSAISPIILLSLISGVLSYLFCRMSNNVWIEFFGGGLIFFAIYILGSIIFKLDEIKTVLSYVRK